MNNSIYNTTHLTVLKGNIPSLKSYIIKDGVAQKGEVVKPSYLYDYETHSINNIDELYQIIQQS